MLTLSKKAQAMPSSPIRKLVPIADAAKQRGIKVYHLNIGQPDIEAPREALDPVKNCDVKVVSYANSAGNLSYRKGLVKYYHSIGIDISVDDIIITSSGTEAAQLALGVTCNQGDEVIVLEPFYTNYNAFAIQNGVTLVPISCDIKDGFKLPPVDEFEKHITPRTKGILICNPGNPTGTLYPEDALNEMARIAKKHDIYIYTDEVYREFCYTGQPHYSCMHIKGVEDNVILMDSVSKRYSLCGVRIGAFISRNKEVIKAVMKYAQARLCAPFFGQIAAEGALNTPPEYFAAVKKEYIHRRNVLLEGLNKIKGVYSPMPMGAFYTIAELPIDDADKFARWLLEDFQYEGQTVMVAPAAGFYSTPGKGKTQVRLAYVLKVEDLKAALKCLEEALKVYPGRTDR